MNEYIFTPVCTSSINWCTLHALCENQPSMASSANRTELTSSSYTAFHIASRMCARKTTRFGVYSRDLSDKIDLIRARRWMQAKYAAHWTLRVVVVMCNPYVYTQLVLFAIVFTTFHAHIPRIQRAPMSMYGQCVSAFEMKRAALMQR